MLLDLDRLVRLQHLEDFAAGARRTLADHPDRIKALDERLAGARDRLAAERQRGADLQAARREIDRDLAASQARLAKYKDQLMEVKTNREYQAMQKEIEAGRHEVRRLEDALLERMIEADEVVAALALAEEELKKAQAEVEGERERMEQDAERLRRELEASAEERARLVSEVTPPALAVFDQVMRARKGTAVAEARDGHCAVCNVRLRPQLFNEIRRNDALIQCTSCQRILFFAGTMAGEDT